MPLTFTTLNDILANAADTIIDVRTPAEFAGDHIPGAINLPALSNDQRAEIGTMYVQDSPFKARKRGAAMVARNVADHLDGPLRDKDGGWQPLVYCWRGGQRSGSFASILQQIGWRAETIAGGYQTFRRLVHQYLYETPLPHRIILLDGNTGTGKTALLARLRLQGVQVIDLEGLAHHRGSMLGQMPTPQPSQKAFETALACALVRCDPDQPVIIEAESSKIGRINLPPSLWSVMCAAPRVMISASLDARAAFLANAYADVTADLDDLRQRLQPMRYIKSHATVNAWEDLLDANNLKALAASLMQTHYDSAYDKARDGHVFDLVGHIHAETLDDAGLAKVTNQIAALINPAG
ncbi:tRNA 2-selenouridine synthase [Loktanella ponticola]|uniref:tRNA 2-selenouridine synthase n=2 Tax=Yoonia ponticola TaxID=1524255 RepID=A0A7W9BI50_9RHOB|nr:tRNA 2-selenouridine(34) synthase MnmH [Yoonia ponticola]MBB5720599.1 tRNA 2-selenouridine synthase [Yoonia ponticola]